MVVESNRYKENIITSDSEIAIIVTSWDGHLMFLRQTLINYMKSKAYVVCSYDARSKSPPSDVMEIPHSFVFKHKTYGATKRTGWLWDIVYGADVINSISNIKYVFCVNSDCIWDKPDGLKDIIDLLGNADLMASSINSTIHTCSMIFKVDAFKSFNNYIKQKLDNMVPESFSPEAVVRDWASENNIKKQIPPVQAKFPEVSRYAGSVDHYSCYHQDSTWKRLLGFRNLGGELRHCSLEHLEPPPKKYFDVSQKKYYTSHEHVMLDYFETDDRRWLYKFWAEGEDSFWNRRYYPLEYYGDNPLYDDSKRKELGPPSERLGHFDRTKYESFILKDDEYYEKWKKFINKE